MKAIFNRSFIFLILFIIAATNFCQAQLTLHEFIGSALQDEEVRTIADQITYLNGKPYRLSPLKELQFRSQNRELLPTQQEYGIRVNPANPWELKRQNKYFREFNSTLDYEREFALKEALIARYYTAIEYLFYAELYKVSNEDMLKLQEQISILEKQSGSHYFDAEDFVKLKMEELDFTVDAEEQGFEVFNQLQRITRSYPKAHNQNIDWNLSSIISTESIGKVIDSIQQSTLRSSLVAYQQQKIILAKSQYNLEQANFNIGFLQASYDRRRFHQDRNPISISFGISIPITNPNKGDMARRKLEIIEAEYDFKEESHQSETDKVIFYDKVIRLITRVENLEKKIKSLRESDLPRSLSTIRQGDPMVVLQFNRSINKLRTISIKVRHELLIAYIDYLAYTDQLQKEPVINFLSPTLSPILTK
jgi:hypothetical protein